MLYIIYAVHFIICLFLIMVVLLQQGSGADLSVFGGGGTQTAFGARSATNLLHKLTVAAFIGFILTTIAFGFLKTGGGGSVMSEIETTSQAEAAEADESEEAGTLESEGAFPVTEPGSNDDTATPTDGPDTAGPELGDETPEPPSQP